MRSVVKSVVEFVIKNAAQLVNYSFPKTFIWKWKLEYLLEIYEIETTRFFKRNIKPGMVVVDVGANIGYFTRIFSSLVGSSGKVIAFEADEENFEILKKNVAHLTNVEVFNIAIADRTGVIDFYHILGATGTHSLVVAHGADKRTVACESLDTFFKDSRFPDFIKIDVEGAEQQVFDGMKQSLDVHKVTVVFEYQPNSNTELVESLIKKFKVKSISRRGHLQNIEKVSFRKGKVDYANLCLTTEVT
jgi:FkbM family methyltransferase